MARIETWFKQDLKSPVSVRAINGAVFSQDNMGNLIGVTVTDGRADASLSGSVIGYVIRDDGETVVFNGSLSGNKAYIILPESCYAVPGMIKIAIRLVEGSVKTVLCAATAYVTRTSTDAIIDPGSVIPDLTTLLAQIDSCKSATTAANTAAASANTAAAAAEKVSIKESKSGNVITVTVTDRNGTNTSKTITEPTATASKSGEVVTISVTDANGTTTQTLTDPEIKIKLMAENIPNTTQNITFDSDGNVQTITHKSGSTTVRTDSFTFVENTITEKRVLTEGGSLTIVTNTDTLETVTTYSAE